MPVQAGAPIRATGLGRLFSFAWAICVSRGQEGCVREMTQEGAREEERTPCGRGVDKVVSNVGFSVKNSDKILKQTPLFLLCTLRTRLNRAHAYIHQTDLKKTPACILALVYSVAATLPAARHQKTYDLPLLLSKSMLDTRDDDELVAAPPLHQCALIGRIDDHLALVPSPADEQAAS